jgi:hypothetical protein
MLALDGAGKVVFGIYYPDKIEIWRVSGLFLDLPRLVSDLPRLVSDQPRLAFVGLIDQPRSPDSTDGKAVSRVVVSS